MRKQSGDADTTDEQPAGTPAAETPAEVTTAAAAEGEQHFDPKHEWPSGGGCYVRQEDGTLTRED